MKITQTFFTPTKDIKSLNGGWLSPKYHLMSWALSSSLLKKYHPNNELELVTDNFGKHVLIDELDLPYDRVKIGLEDLDLGAFSDLWLLKKLFAHTLHEEPFLFLDGDAFIFEKFDNSLLQGDLIAQNKETNFNIYIPFLRGMLENFDYLPDWITKDYKVNKSYFASNTGVTGGQNFKFFKSFYAFVIDFLEKNQSHLKSIPSHVLNLSIEQFLFYQLAQSQEQEISYLFNKRFQANYLGFNNFHEVPDKRNYLHLMMSNKKVIHNCEQLEKRLKRDFPAIHQNINDLFEREIGIKTPPQRKVDFYRTKRALEKKESFKELNFIQQVEKIKDGSVDSETFKLYEYEQEVASLYKKIDANANVMNQFQLKEFDEIFSGNQDSDSFEVSINPCVKRLEIDRKWVQRNEMNIFINVRETYEMSSKNHQLENVLLYYHPDQNLIGEYILLSEKLIFDWLEANEKMKLSELYDLIDDYCRTTYKFYIKKILHEKIRFFIYQNILLITPVNNQSDEISSKSSKLQEQI
jgi:hypothetical protein